MFEENDDPIFPLFKPGVIENLAYNMALIIAPILQTILEPIMQKLAENGRARSGGKIKKPL